MRSTLTDHDLIDSISVTSTPNLANQGKVLSLDDQGSGLTSHILETHSTLYAMLCTYVQPYRAPNQCLQVSLVRHFPQATRHTRSLKKTITLAYNFGHGQTGPNLMTTWMRTKILDVVCGFWRTKMAV